MNQQTDILIQKQIIKRQGMQLHITVHEKKIALCGIIGHQIRPSRPPKRIVQNKERKVKKNKVKARKGDIKERHTWKQRRDELKKKKKQ